ncbi:MAG: T9SS type A sorting domain-containing protein [Bacteroidetes bacterium]|nr:MAG: T9SS type A sorting domain-containing protein [Bacteroidota bacterium]
MKNVFLLFVLLGCFTVNGQYLNSAFPETTYDLISPSANIHNVGTDTRSGSSYYGGSPSYANYLNVTVSDYNAGATGGRNMYWESSASTTGALPLAAYDALDPDVVLVKGTNPLDVYAIVVYYSASALGDPGYYMSVASFDPGSYEFDPFNPPMLIQPYIPVSGYPAHINIDSDNNGNYAVVFQRNGGIESRTATYTSGTPPLPGNSIGYPGLIEPDVSISVHSTPDRVKIVALNENRDQYVIRTRQIPAVPGLSFTSAPMFQLHMPRIASPTTMSTEYSVTMSRRVGGQSNILYNTFNGITPLGLKTINDGSEGAPYPTSINMYDNVLPAITYHSYLGSEKLTIAWHAQYVPGVPVGLTNQFVGLDIDPVSRTPVTAGVYLDMSYNTAQTNNLSTIALSGRYTDWCKTTAFSYGSGLFAPTELVWKYIYSFETSWKATTSSEDVDGSGSNDWKVYPSPANTLVHLDNLGNDVIQDIRIQDVTGRTVYRAEGVNAPNSIDVSMFTEGVYFLSLQTNAGLTTKKFVVKH